MESYLDSAVQHFGQIELLIFCSGGIIFGADVEGIVEILDAENTTIEKLPDLPELIRDDLEGFTKFRNRVLEVDEELAVISLNHQLNLVVLGGQNISAAEDNQVIVIENKYGYLGIQVDQIDTIINLEIQHIDPVPDFVADRIEVESLWGMGKASKTTEMLTIDEQGIGDLIMLIELNEILPDERLRSLQTIAYSEFKGASESLGFEVNSDS